MGCLLPTFSEPKSGALSDRASFLCADRFVLLLDLKPKSASPTAKVHRTFSDTHFVCSKGTAPSLNDLGDAWYRDSLYIDINMAVRHSSSRKQIVPPHENRLFFPALDGFDSGRICDLLLCDSRTFGAYFGRDSIPFKKESDFILPHPFGNRRGRRRRSID